MAQRIHPDKNNKKGGVMTSILDIEYDYAYFSRHFFLDRAKRGTLLTNVSN